MTLIIKTICKYFLKISLITDEQKDPDKRSIKISSLIDEIKILHLINQIKLINKQGVIRNTNNYDKLSSKIKSMVQHHMNPINLKFYIQLQPKKAQIILEKYFNKSYTYL